jgi:hypothetical protein
MLAEK